MKSNHLPDTIQTILAQAGGLGLTGAFAYIGAQRFSYRCAEPHGEYRSSYPSRLNPEGGQISVDFDVGLRCRVNGQPGHDWTLIIAYEPDDTYTVWLVEGHAERQPDTLVLACHRDVYCDILQTVIEQSYDRAINERNGGFIPLV